MFIINSLQHNLIIKANDQILNYKLMIDTNTYLGLTEEEFQFKLNNYLPKCKSCNRQLTLFCRDTCTYKFLCKYCIDQLNRSHENYEHILHDHYPLKQFYKDNRGSFEEYDINQLNSFINTFNQLINNLIDDVQNHKKQIQDHMDAIDQIENYKIRQIQNVIVTLEARKRRKIEQMAQKDKIFRNIKSDLYLLELSQMPSELKIEQYCENMKQYIADLTRLKYNRQEKYIFLEELNRLLYSRYQDQINKQYYDQINNGNGVEIYLRIQNELQFISRYGYFYESVLNWHTRQELGNDEIFQNSMTLSSSLALKSMKVKLYPLHFKSIKISDEIIYFKIDSSKYYYKLNFIYHTNVSRLEVNGRLTRKQKKQVYQISIKQNLRSLKIQDENDIKIHRIRLNCAIYEAYKLRKMHSCRLNAIRSQILQMLVK